MDYSILILEGLFGPKYAPHIQLQVDEGNRLIAKHLKSYEDIWDKCKENFLKFMRGRDEHQLNKEEMDTYTSYNYLNEVIVSMDGTLRNSIRHTLKECINLNKFYPEKIDISIIQNVINMIDKRCVVIDKNIQSHMKRVIAVYKMVDTKGSAAKKILQQMSKESKWTKPLVQQKAMNKQIDEELNKLGDLKKVRDYLKHKLVADAIDTMGKM